MKKSTVLRELLASKETLVMPDAYDPISARVIEQAGFQAVQCSGGSISIAGCLESETALTLEGNLDCTRRIAGAVQVPVMADGEDGYGDAVSTGTTVERFISAGAAGINIEDAVPTRSKQISLVDVSSMTAKIVSAREAANRAGDPDFIINARTDALRGFASREDGLQEAIMRANCYLEAGADLAFICYAATLDEVKALTGGIRGGVSIAAGLPYNIGAFTIADLAGCGVARVSIPMLAILASVKALMTSIASLKDPDGFARVADGGLCASMSDIAELLSPYQRR